MKSTLALSFAAALACAWDCTLLGATNPALMARWGFDETSGNLAHDAVGSYHGQLSATGASFEPGGISGNALRLNRSANGYVEAPHLLGLTSGDFSITAWARTETTAGSGVMTLLSQHRGWIVNGFLIQFNTTEANTAGSQARLLVNSGSYGLTSSTPVNDGEWHHVVVAYARTGLTRLYVDGAPAEAELGSIPITVDPAVPFVIGGVYGMDIANVTSGFFSGRVDDVQVYRGALNETQVSALFNSPGRSLADLEEPLNIVPDGGGFVGSVRVTITSNTPGTRIVYTVDDRDPVANSAEYAGAFTLTESAVVRARLFVNEFPASEIVSAAFMKVPAVTFEPGPSLFTNSVAVTLRNNQGTGILRYTLDGSEPTATSLTYSEPVLLSAAATLRARLFVNSFPVSDVFEATYSRVYAMDDGLDSAWRERYFGPGYLTDPRVAAGADPDGDGWNNLLEYQSGTVPTDGTSKPTIQAGIRTIPQVSWNSVPGFTYRVLRKSALNAPAWEPVLSAFLATESVSTFVDPGAPATAIYQIELAP